MFRLWLVGCFFFFTAAAVQAQRDFRYLPPDIFDTHPTALDPAHFQMVFENPRVQVIRVRLGPHEKSMVMEIPAHVLACVTDRHVKVYSAHGKPAERADKAGYSVWLDRDEYGFENLDDKPAEWILVVPNGPEKSG
jgi:hypothetical protein